MMTQLIGDMQRIMRYIARYTIACIAVRMFARSLLAQICVAAHISMPQSFALDSSLSSRTKPATQTKTQTQAQIILEQATQKQAQSKAYFFPYLSLHPIALESLMHTTTNRVQLDFTPPSCAGTEMNFRCKSSFLRIFTTTHKPTKEQNHKQELLILRDIRYGLESTIEKAHSLKERSNAQYFIESTIQHTDELCRNIAMPCTLIPRHARLSITAHKDTQSHHITMPITLELRLESGDSIRIQASLFSQNPAFDKQTIPMIHHAILQDFIHSAPHNISAPHSTLESTRNFLLRLHATLESTKILRQAIVRLLLDDELYNEYNRLDDTHKRELIDTALRHLQANVESTPLRLRYLGDFLRGKAHRITWKYSAHKGTQGVWLHHIARVDSIAGLILLLAESGEISIIN